MKVMIAVTHLLGTGHLSRALTLAHGFRQAGHGVLLASGGLPVPHLNHDGIEVLQVPPVRSDGTAFTRLLTDDNRTADTAWLEARTRALCGAVAGFRPDVLICELFPFGRRVLADEFLAMLGTARGLDRPARTLCSIRDILAPPSKPEKAARVQAILNDWFDGVLVHSDPSATRLDASWPVTPDLEPFLHYTGYVAPAPAGPHPQRAGDGEVLVTSGGGPVGDRLFAAALDAAQLTPDRKWHLLVGGSDGDSRIARLAAQAGNNVQVEATRPDFRQMLYHARASVSMCGYNTALDVLQAGTPGVLVPFDDGQEVEQTLRCASLARMDGFCVLPQAELTGAKLARAVDQVENAPRRAVAGLQFDGAAQSVRIAETLTRGPA